MTKPFLSLLGFALSLGCVANDELPQSDPTESTMVDQGVYPEPVLRTYTHPGQRNMSSNLRAWSHDAKYFLTVALKSGRASIIRPYTLQHYVTLPYTGHRWIGDTNDILVMHENHQIGAALIRYSVDSYHFEEPIRLGHPGLRARRSHRETSRDGQWVAVYIDIATSGGPRVQTVNLDQKEVVLDISIADLGCTVEPEWVGVDPHGDVLLVQSPIDGTGACQGLWAHDIETGDPVHQIIPHNRPGGLGVSWDERAYYLSTDVFDAIGSPYTVIIRTYIDDASHHVHGKPIPMGAFESVSCLDVPGSACLVSASHEAGDRYQGKLWWLEDDGSHTLIEDHNASTCSYWGQARATVGPRGRYTYGTHNEDCAEIHAVIVHE